MRTTYRPQPGLAIEKHTKLSSTYPHPHGDDKKSIHQEPLRVFHNPQALLPLLDIYLSPSHKGEWGRTGKDIFR
jgi:hypothetical protein